MTEKASELPAIQVHETRSRPHLHHELTGLFRNYEPPGPLDPAPETVGALSPDTTDLRKEAAPDGGTANARQDFVDAFDAGRLQPAPLTKPNRLVPWVPPLDGFPGWVASLISSIGHSVSAPVVYAVVPFLVYASALVGGKIRVKGRDNWYVATNLWGLNIGNPGTNKGAAARHAFAPIRKLEAQWHEEYKAQYQVYQRELKKYELNKRKLERDYQANREENPQVADDLLASLVDNAPKPPVQRMLAVTNATPERAEVAMEQNPGGFLVNPDELGAINAQFQQQGRETLRSLLMTAWEGTGSLRTIRMSRETVNVPEPLCCFFSTTQPDHIEKMLRQEDHDGYLVRFQVVGYPIGEPYVEWDGTIDATQEAAWDELLRRIESLDPVSVGARQNEKGQYYLDLTEEARTLFRAWVNFTKSVSCQDHLVENPYLRSILAKAPSLPLKLASVLHLLAERHGDIQIDTLVDAIVLSLVFFTHAERMVTESSADTCTPPEIRIVELLQDEKLKPPFTARSIKQRELRGLKGDRVDQGIATLVERGWLRRVDTQSIGRPKTEYRVNPKLYDATFDGSEGGLLQVVLKDVFREKLGPFRPQFERYAKHDGIRTLFGLDLPDVQPVAPASGAEPGNLVRKQEGDGGLLRQETDAWTAVDPNEEDR